MLVNLQLMAFLLLQEGGGAVQFDLLSMWNQMGWLARFVVIIMFVMSAYSIGVMIDRVIAYNGARNQSRQFAPAVAGALREGKLDEAIKIADRFKKSHLAKVVVAGLQEFRAHNLSADISGEQIEASRRALERAEAIVHAELKRGVSTLATIGSSDRSLDYSGLLSASSMRSKAFRLKSRPAWAQLPAVFPRRSSPPLSVWASRFPPFGLTTISSPAWNRSTSKWATPPPSCLTIS